VDQGSNKHLEIRSNAAGPGMLAGLTVSGTFCLHQLDLHPTLDDLFRAFHSNCIRRKIVRASREGLIYDDGTSEELLLKFYRLVVRTRRRKGIPPQPLSWFRNLIACIGDKAKLRLASHEGKPVAGILTICHKSTMTYKYACSEPEFHKMGPMQILIWRAIQEAKETGLAEFEMGRTDWRNEGLLTFKDRWGCTRATLVYLRNPARRRTNFTELVGGRIAKRVIASLPESILPDVGRFLYRHFA
jgi:lipid II:glycine glycyltransferase (peptidoglycan interpeptide bridge formation enzyme)